MVLDGCVRQQGQDPLVPPAHFRAGGVEPLLTANTRLTDGRQGRSAPGLVENLTK
jgi:hypothetical protein